MKVDIKKEEKATVDKQKKVQKSWPELWREQLMAKNNQILAKTQEKKVCVSSKLWQAAGSGKTIVQFHNYKLEDHGEGPYSQYLPLTSSITIPNEINNCLPYIDHLSSLKSENYEEELYEIAQSLSNSNCLQEWRQICKKYALGLGLVQLVNIYLQVLARGTIVLSEYSDKYNCKIQYLAFQVFQLGKLFKPKSKVFTNKIEKGNKIDLDSMSKTFKLLFCQICLIYDCNKHNISETAVQHNYQYTRRYWPEERLNQKINTALTIMKKLANILSNQKNEQLEIGCSIECYKLLTAEKWTDSSAQRKKKPMSRVFRIYIQMGIHLFSFDPCQIKQLFGKNKACDLRLIETNVKCFDIFYYLLQDYDLKKKLEYKFAENQQEYFRNIPKEIKNNQANRPKRRLKSKSKIQKHGHTTDGSFNAICFHYFTNCEPEDLDCRSCQCRKRGYCLPACQCSQFCILKLKGCKCKASTSGCLSSCPCYKQKRVCMPQICHCFHSENSQGANWCENSQIALSSPKRTKIGQSTIKNAGLGLFSGECIQRGEFVITYIGEIIESQSLQKLRQNLTQKQGQFYNFRLDNNVSIDSRYFGNKSRFINHSVKNQNLRVQKIRLNEEQLLIFRAIKDIEKDQQLFFDYNGGGALTDHKDKYPFIE